MKRMNRVVLDHAVQREHHDTRSGACLGHELPDGTVGRDRHLPHGVVELLALELGRRAGGAAMVPDLVAAAMQIAEAEKEQVPSLLAHQVRPTRACQSAAATSTSRNASSSRAV